MESTTDMDLDLEDDFESMNSGDLVEPLTASPKAFAHLADDLSMDEDPDTPVAPSPDLDATITTYETMEPLSARNAAFADVKFADEVQVTTYRRTVEDDEDVTLDDLDDEDDEFLGPSSGEDVSTQLNTKLNTLIGVEGGKMNAVEAQYPAKESAPSVASVHSRPPRTLDSELELEDSTFKSLAAVDNTRDDTGDGDDDVEGLSACIGTDMGVENDVDDGGEDDNGEDLLLDADEVSDDLDKYASHAEQVAAAQRQREEVERRAAAEEEERARVQREQDEAVAAAIAAAEREREKERELEREQERERQRLEAEAAEAAAREAEVVAAAAAEAEAERTRAEEEAARQIEAARQMEAERVAAIAKAEEEERMRAAEQAEREAREAREEEECRMREEREAQEKQRKEREEQEQREKEERERMARERERVERERREREQREMEERDRREADAKAEQERVEKERQKSEERERKQREEREERERVRRAEEEVAAAVQRQCDYEEAKRAPVEDIRVDTPTRQTPPSAVSSLSLSPSRVPVMPPVAPLGRPSRPVSAADSSDSPPITTMKPLAPSSPPSKKPPPRKAPLVPKPPKPVSRVPTQAHVDGLVAKLGKVNEEMSVLEERLRVSEEQRASQKKTENRLRHELQAAAEKERTSALEREGLLEMIEQLRRELRDRENQHVSDRHVRLAEITDKEQEVAASRERERQSELRCQELHIRVSELKREKERLEGTVGSLAKSLDESARREDALTLTVRGLEGKVFEYEQLVGDMRVEMGTLRERTHKDAEDRAKMDAEKNVFRQRAREKERQAVGLERDLWSYRQLLKYLAVSTWVRQTRLASTLQQFAQGLRDMAVASLAKVTGIDRSKRLNESSPPRRGLNECVSELVRNISDSFSVMQKTLEHVAKERDEWRDVSKAVARGNVEVVSKWWVLEQTYRQEKEQEQMRQVEEAKQRDKHKYEQRKDVLVRAAAAHKQKALTATWDATTLWRRVKIEHVQRLFEHTVALKRRAARLQSVCAQTQAQTHSRVQGTGAGEADTSHTGTAPRPARPVAAEGASRSKAPPSDHSSSSGAVLQRRSSPQQAWGDSQPLSPTARMPRNERREEGRDVLPPVTGPRRGPRGPVEGKSGSVCADGGQKSFDWKRLYGISNAQPPPPEAYASNQQPAPSRRPRVSPERRRPVMPQTHSLQQL